MVKLFIAAILATAAIAFGARFHPRHCPRYHVRIFKYTAHNAHGLKPGVEMFRKALGGVNNGNQRGPLKNGQREINWDGGAPFIMPNDLFNRVVPRGAVFFTKLNLFALSNPPNQPPFDDNKFSSLNKRAARQFKTFSSPRLFAALLDTKITTKFFVPGTEHPATVSGFGAVYTDVDLKHTSFLTLYDRRGCIVAKIAVPPKDKGLSFVGAIVKSVRYPGGRHRKHPHYPKYIHAPVYKAVLKLGNAPLVQHNKCYRRSRRYARDFVATDNFIYGEPQKL